MSVATLTRVVVILVFGIKTGRASIITHPVTSETPIGELAYFNCSTTKTTEAIQWFHYPDPGSQRILVYGFDQFHDGYKGFRMDKVDSTGSWNLVIPSVASENAGRYECQDDIGRGDKSRASLIVLGSSEFESRIETKNVIGSNNCGIEPSQLILSCNVEYHGSEAPTFEWKKVGDDTPISDGVAQEILSNNHIKYTITFRGDAIETGSSYACYAKHSKSHKANCKSGNITVGGNGANISTWKYDSCQRYIDAIICIIFIIMPFFNAVTAYVLWRLYMRRQSDKIYRPKEEENSKGSRFPFSKDAIIFVLLMAIPFCIGLLLWYLCIYRRKQLANETVTEHSVVEESRSLNEPKIEASSADRPTEGQSQAAEEQRDKLKEQKARNRQQNETIASLRKHIAQNGKDIKEIEKRNLELLEEIQYLKENVVKELEMDLYPPETDEYVDKPTLVHTITTEVDTNEHKTIRGLAVLENELFLLHENSSQIEVYDSVTYQFARELKIPKIEQLFDLTTGKKDKRLYIIGLSTKAEEQRESLIGKVDAKGKLLEPWPRPSGGNKGRLSVWESNIIVCLLEKNIINEFSRDGDLIRTVRLSPAAGFKNLLHVIKVTSMHYVVSHGGLKDEHHRICVVSLEGNIIKECKEWKRKLFVKLKLSAEFNTPLDFVTDAERSVFVADTGHNRILLFNSALKYQRISIEFKATEFPARICFDETQKRLFVATDIKSLSKGFTDGQVLIFNIK